MEKLVNGIDALLGKHRKAVTYLFVGGLLFLIDYSVSLFAYHYLDFGPGIASATGFCSSFIVGFTLNKRVVFKHDKTSQHSLNMQIALYLLLATFNLFFTSWIVEVAVNQGVRIEVIKPIVVIAAAFWNYIILGNYVFGHKKVEQVE